MAQPRTISASAADNARLHAVQVMLCARIEEVFDALGVDMAPSGRKYEGPCPVHGGDNPQACNLYHEGDTVPGYWRCYTHGCERHFKKTVIGFVRGVLSNQRHCWTGGRADKTVSFPETLAWCCEFLGQKLEDVKVDEAELEKRRFASEVARLTRRARQGGEAISRETVRKWLQIPADYFVQRGWDPKVLNRYDAGLYPTPGKPLSDRVAVPVYDEVYKQVLGFTARSVFEQCAKCSRWHAPASSCPDRSDRLAFARSSKWYNHNFDRDSTLYNWWFARKRVEEIGVACLVEGPGDLWRLEEAGVTCGLALLGAGLTEQQQVLLEMSGAMTLIVLTNMDEAGRGAADSLKQRLARLFRIVVPELKTKDLGEMAAPAVASLVGPLVEKYRRKF